jgi:prolyl oligopeptidase
MIALVLAVFAGFAAPPTATEAVTDTYHGTTVTEQYRWLEDWSAPAVKAWSEAQNVHARAFLGGLKDAPAIRARVASILGAKTVRFYGLAHRGGQTFAMKRQPPKQQPFLVLVQDLAHPEQGRIIVDPNAIDPSGLTHIDWYIPSPDGALVAVSMSKGGTESGDVHLFDVATGKATGEVVPRVNGGTAGGDLAWAPDGKGFYYTRYPRAGERPEADLPFYQQLFFHALGTPTAEDRYELGKGFPRISEIQLEVHPSGLLMATVQNGDSGRFAHHLRDTKGAWRQFSAFGDGVVQASFGPKDDLFVLSREGAPRGKIQRVQIADLKVKGAPVVVPQGEHTIVNDFWGTRTVFPTADRLFVVYQLGGPSEIRLFDLTGKALPKPEQLPVGAVWGLTPLGEGTMLFANNSYLQPRAWYRFEGGVTTKTALEDGTPVQLDGVEVRREFAVSKDGTKVPLNILLPKGAKLDGENPCLVTGYGGFNVSLAPRFGAIRKVLLEQGVIVVVANLRGGSEFGEAWHTAGNLTQKQNVFDDFAAVLEHLAARKYTRAGRLAITGGSNGGLLMGATLVQHPELMTAVVARVGIYDMLRVELSSNGAFNIPEFGTVKDAAQFKAMHAYSPYHNARDGVHYPATLFLTGANDPRVDPMQSRKMTARLQAATAGKAPILLRTHASSGHGGGKKLDARIAEYVDRFGFVFHHLGVKYEKK